MMNPEKIEKIFWLLLVAWFVIRSLLLGSQYVGQTDPAVKSEVLQYFSQTDIDAGRDYALGGFWFKAVYGSAYMLLLVILLKSGFFTSLWERITAWSGEGLFRNDLLFTLAFLMIIEALSFPSSLYFGYWREAAAGFANTGPGGWLLKFVKSAAVGIAFETAGILIMLAVLRWFPSRWPVVIPLVMGVFGVLVTLLIPVVITPLFYDQKPLEAGEFRTRLLEMSEKAGMKVKDIYVIDESRYSKHTNAYFTGLGAYRRIVLYDNLIKSHTPDEAALIFAHEAGHWRYNHVAWGLTLGVMGMLFIGLAYHLVFPSLAAVSWFGLGGIASAGNIPFLMIVAMMFQLFTAPIESQISQFMERQADETALRLTGLNDVYKAAQIRLSRDNRSDLLPHPLRVFWLYTHPPALERIKAADQPSES